jgi:hypothetical protein
LGIDLKHLRLFLLAFLTAFTGLSQAASVSFGLNENNIDSLGNTIDYATVTISDGIVAGDIDFVIDVNNDFFDEGNNFGIQSFFFNSLLSIGPLNVIATSNTNWAFLTDFGDRPNDGFNASEFGRFNITYRGTGNMREDPLAFTIRADGDEDLMTYALNNTRGFAFAAHIAGFNNVEGADSGWFASDLSPIPVPASFWLFGTALIGFIGISRRTRV